MKYTRYIKPMLARLHGEAFDDAGWIYEIKWDGYRAIAEVGQGVAKLYSRNGLSFAADYPVIFEALKKIRKTVVLDGEIVVMDSKGKPSFQLIQQYLQGQDLSICYYVFDCLSLNGKSIEEKTLIERKKILRSVLPASDYLKYCDHIEGEGRAFFSALAREGLEGMIAKRAASTYTEGKRSADWLKVKHTIMEEAVIAGYTQTKGSRKYFGALILGTYEHHKLKYIGHTGAGFTEQTLEEVYHQLQPLIAAESPFDEKIKVNAPVTWVWPRLVCNLKYAEATGSGSRRHPVFMGLRADKSPKEVHPEILDNRIIAKNNKSNHMKKTHDAASGVDKGVEKLSFSHLDKVFWPEEGYTKGDVMKYSSTTYPQIIEYMKGRPESLHRQPNGIREEGFFHKDAGLPAPDWITTKAIHSESAGKDVHYIICNDKPTLLYLANLGCIEMNPWNSTLEKLDSPDYLILDIDPSKSNTYDQVIETAIVIKEILDRAGAISYPKTSGATGMHIYVPLGAKYTYEQAKDFAHIVAKLAQVQLPGFTSLERTLSKRGDNIYIDYLQNRKGQTLACAYSLRPMPGATVSAPLDWKEVKKGLTPADFNMNNIMARIDKKGDLFSGVLLKGIDMQKCLEQLESIG